MALFPPCVARCRSSACRPCRQFHYASAASAHAPPRPVDNSRRPAQHMRSRSSTDEDDTKHEDVQHWPAPIHRSQATARGFLFPRASVQHCPQARLTVPADSTQDRPPWLKLAPRRLCGVGFFPSDPPAFHVRADWARAVPRASQRFKTGDLLLSKNYAGTAVMTAMIRAEELSSSCKPQGMTSSCGH